MILPPTDYWPAPLPYAPTMEEALALADEIAEGWKHSMRPTNEHAPTLHALAWDIAWHRRGENYWSALSRIEKETLLWLVRCTKDDRG